MSMSPFYAKVNGMTVAYRDADALENVVRNALFEWYNDAECPVYGRTGSICCQNDEVGRFNPCSVCKAIEKATANDQAWLECGEDMLPYKIQLPRNAGTPARTIEAWARS